MSDEHAIQLLNRELDGELDATAHAELNALLAADPELAAQRGELHSLQRTLRAVADAESPPPDLTRRIVHGIVLPTQAGIIERLVAWWRTPIWVPAAAFAMGLAVAVILYPTLERSLGGANATHMTGTLISESTPAGLMPHARLALALDALQGQVTLAHASGTASLLEFDLATTGTVDIAVDLGGSGLVYQPQGTRGVVVLLAQEGSQVRLRSEGQHYFALALLGEAAEDGSIKVEFSAEGRVLSAGVLEAR